MIVICLFTKAIRQYSILDWSLEQKWLILLLFFVIFYNNPLYPLIFLFNHSFPLILDTFFRTSFLCTLLFFWLSIYHGIRQNNRRYLSFYLPKLILICLLWIFSISLSFNRIYQEYSNPVYNLTINLNEYSIIRMFFYLLSFVYSLYLVFLIIRAYGELHHMPYFDIRLKFHTILMFSVLSISITMFLLRFSRSIFEEYFIPELVSRFKNSVEFLLISSLLNIYLYTMTYVYLPGKNARMDSLFHDNPTFSMINDSDEDIVYE